MEDFSKRRSAYSKMAQTFLAQKKTLLYIGATTAFALSGNNDADAQCYYQDLIPDIPVDHDTSYLNGSGSFGLCGGGSGTVLIDVNDDGIFDLRFEQENSFCTTGGTSESANQVVPLNGASIVIYPSQYVANPLSNGALVDSGLDWIGSRVNILTLSNSFTGVGSNWISADPKFLGIRIPVAGGGFQYGWVRASFTPTPPYFSWFNLYDHCISIVADVPVIAGEIPYFLDTYADIVVSGDDETCETVVTYPEVKSQVSVVQTEGLPSGAGFPFGTTTNTFVATDTYGDSDTVSFNVTVNYPPSVGDDCSAPVVLPGAGTYVGLTGNASSTGLTSSCSFNDEIDVWYEYTVPSGLDALRIYTCGSNFDTGLSLWDGCAGAEIACNDDGDFGGGSSDCGGSDFQSNIELDGSALDAIEGTTVLIRLSGFNNSSGCGDLVVEETAGCNASTTPTGFSATTTAGLINFSWDPVPASVGCQLQAGPLGSGFPWDASVLGFETTGTTFPATAVPPGNYQARVVCACDISPLVLTGASNADLFVIPSPRIGNGEAEISLAPNPASDNISLLYPQAESENLALTVFDITGNALIERSVSLYENSNVVDLDLSDLNPGVYLLRLVDGDSVITKRFEVVR